MALLSHKRLCLSRLFFSRPGKKKFLGLSLFACPSYTLFCSSLSSENFWHPVRIKLPHDIPISIPSAQARQARGLSLFPFQSSLRPYYRKAQGLSIGFFPSSEKIFLGLFDCQKAKPAKDGKASSTQDGEDFPAVRSLVMP